MITTTHKILLSLIIDTLWKAETLEDKKEFLLGLVVGVKDDDEDLWNRFHAAKTAQDYGLIQSEILIKMLETELKSGRI